MNIRISIIVFFCALGSSLQARSQDAEVADTSAAGLAFEAAAYYYYLPHETDQITPLFYADYKFFHFEGRYNYEDKNTASVFVGRRFETGNKCIFGATPMMGIVFGNTTGFAPGLLLDLSYGKFDFYSESEFLFDSDFSENNFFYTWTEMAVSPTEHLRAGISASRTRIIDTGLDFQRGIFGQYSFGNLTAGIHYFNPFSADYYLIATLSYSF
jgi:hypothetical protein